jgi:hypothetical protein
MQLTALSVLVEEQERALRFSTSTRARQQARCEAGRPVTALITSQLDAGVARPEAPGLVFRGEPQTHGELRAVVFEGPGGTLDTLAQP